jgi:hypothetical protein
MPWYVIHQHSFTLHMMIDFPGCYSHLSHFSSASETISLILVLILVHMEHTPSIVVDVSILPWFSIGHFATFAHGEDGLRTLTTQAQFSNIYCPGLIVHLSNVRITLTLIILEMILAPHVVVPAPVLRSKQDMHTCIQLHRT